MDITLMDTADPIARKRAEFTRAYERQLASLERVERAYDAARAIIADWSRSAESRAGRIYVGDGSLHMTLQLARGDIFADAEEFFDRAQVDLRAAFPAEWEGEWSEVEDKSDTYEARRGSNLPVSPVGKQFYDGGCLLFLNVTATLGDGAACRVVQIGVEERTETVAVKKQVPVYRSICPGDPDDLRAAKAAFDRTVTDAVEHIGALVGQPKDAA